MTLPNVDDLIARLDQHLAQLADPLDCRSDRERAEVWTARSTAVQCLTVLRNVANDFDKPTRLLRDCEARRAAVRAKQAELEQAIAAFPDARTVGDARACDTEWQRQQAVRRQVTLLENGQLFQSPGVCFEPVVYLNRRIGELTEKIAGLRARLETHVRLAEQLLDEPVHSSR